MTQLVYNRDADPFSSTFSRSCSFWTLAIAGAVAFNLALFLFLPALIDDTPPQLEAETLIPQVRIVRIQEKTPPKKNKVIEQQPEKKFIPPPKKTTIKPPLKKLTLNFELNPRLPDAPDSLQLQSPPANIGLDGDTIFQEGELDEPMTILARVAPIYPLRARTRNIEGHVTVSFIVNEKGDVNQIKILNAEPPGTFDKSVIQCVSSWRFKPGTIEGVPVQTRVETTIKFQLR